MPPQASPEDSSPPPPPPSNAKNDKSLAGATGPKTSTIFWGSAFLTKAPPRLHPSEVGSSRKRYVFTRARPYHDMCVCVGGGGGTSALLCLISSQCHRTRSSASQDVLRISKLLKSDREHIFPEQPLLDLRGPLVGAWRSLARYINM